MFLGHPESASTAASDPEPVETTESDDEPDDESAPEQSRFAGVVEWFRSFSDVVAPLSALFSSIVHAITVWQLIKKST